MTATLNISTLKGIESKINKASKDHPSFVVAEHKRSRMCIVIKHTHDRILVEDLAWFRGLAWPAKVEFLRVNE